MPVYDTPRPARRDHRDLALQGFAVELHDRELDVATWREVAKVAIEHLHQANTEARRLRDQLHTLREQYRKLRATVPAEQKDAA